MGRSGLHLSAGSSPALPTNMAVVPAMSKAFPDRHQCAV